MDYMVIGILFVLLVCVVLLFLEIRTLRARCSIYETRFDDLIKELCILREENKSHDSKYRAIYCEHEHLNEVQCEMNKDMLVIKEFIVTFNKLKKKYRW